MSAIRTAKANWIKANGGLFGKDMKSAIGIIIDREGTDWLTDEQISDIAATMFAREQSTRKMDAANRALAMRANEAARVVQVAS